MTIVYYGDGTKYSGDSPPARDVQVIVQEHPKVGWHTQAGYDYYIWRDGRYVGVDLFGLYDILLDSGLVLFGRTITATEFNAIMKQAIEDLGDAKSGWLSGEKKPDG